MPDSTQPPKQPTNPDSPEAPTEDLLPGGIPREELLHEVQRAIEEEVRHRDRGFPDPDKKA